MKVNTTKDRYVLLSAGTSTTDKSYELFRNGFSRWS